MKKLEGTHFACGGDLVAALLTSATDYRRSVSSEGILDVVLTLREAVRVRLSRRASVARSAPASYRHHGRCPVMFSNRAVSDGARLPGINCPTGITGRGTRAESGEDAQSGMDRGGIDERRLEQEGE